MFINKVLYYNEEDSDAEVSVSDGLYTINCYAYPVNNVFVNQQINSIYGFKCVNITKADKRNYAITKLDQHYAYQITAQVVDNVSGIVRIGEIFVHIDNYIPKDIINGDYISFSVLRLDCN